MTKKLDRTPLGEDRLSSFIEELLAALSLEEKLYQMHGRTSIIAIIGHRFILQHYNYRPYWAAGVERFGIPPMGFTDGPRGVVAGNSTCFPVAMARAATWDPELNQRVGEAIGRECRAQGANYFGGVCVNILTHPCGGRAQEGYGEDSFLIGEMGAALVRGVSRHNVMACVKHFALNNIEDTRLKGVDVTIGERALREVYLPHFKKCIDAGAASVMAAYNKVRGEYCCENEYLLGRILKQEWGFTGFVISDFIFGIHDPAAAANAGLDMEMCGSQNFGKKLLREVQAGRVPLERIDDAARRVLTTIVRYETQPDPETYTKELVVSAAHVELARQVAEESIVLLKNEASVLPLDPASVESLAVFGKLAKEANTGDHGSSEVKPPYVVTPYQGISKYASQHGMRVDYAKGNKLSQVQALARQVDFCIVVVGLSHSDEGEGGIDYLKLGGDRDTLSLHAEDIALIEAVAQANPNLAVVLIGGSAITVEEWRDKAQAILMAFYGGIEGGTALASVLFGEVNPSGCLPFAVPRQMSDLPEFDHTSLNVTYDYFHGYTYLDRQDIQPAFPFGFGLSYTSFKFEDLTAWREAETLRARVQVTNTGGVDGKVVVQGYVGWVGSAVPRPVRALKAFKKIALRAGETQAVELSIPISSLAYYDEASQAWIQEDIHYEISVGACNLESELLCTQA